MGRDKLLAELGGVPLVRRVYLALRPVCAEILAVGERRSPLPRGAWIEDARPGRRGPLAGIEAALMAARHRSVFVAAGDMPFLTGELVGGLLEILASSGALAVVPRCGGMVHPLCAAYDRDATLPAVSSALDRGILAARALLEGLPGVVYAEEGTLRGFGEPACLLANINSPADLDRARAALGGQGFGGRP